MAQPARPAPGGTAGPWRFGRNGGRGRAFQRDGARKKRGFLRRFWWVFVVVPMLAAAGLFGTLWYVYANLQIPNAPPGPQTTFVYDRSGKVVTTFHAEINRTEIPFDQMPQSLRNAVIAVEDKGFYHHGGISVFGIVRAAWANVTHGKIEQGGSTITQQYVKNVYTGSERTVGRKIKEAMLAAKLEHKYTKNEILEKYLNTIYFGNGAYGVEAAARTYFGIHARQLSVVQSATLAGLIASPATFDPVKNPDAAKNRRNLVLDDMVKQGYLDQAQAAELKQRPVKVRTPKTTSSGNLPYFVDYVRRELLAKYGEDETYRGGLRVHTTVDSTWQRAAEQAVADHLKAKKDPTAALVAIDPRTGAVRALVGGRDFATSKFNNALQAHRQAGSAFKTFTLSAAMEQHVDPHSTWNGPPEIVIPDPRCFTQGKPWDVHNYADEKAGTMTLLDATANSVNTIFAQLVVAVGPDNVANVANRMGIASHLDAVCSITLGSQDITPMDMADAYATLAGGGRPVQGQCEGAVGPPAERRGPGDAGPPGRGDPRDRHRGGPLGSPGGRQDRNGPGLPGRLVLRLHAPARDVRVGRLPEG